MKKKSESIKTENIPDSPGVYLIKGLYGKVLYVGKARNLKKRVSSYFQKNLTGKTFYLMSNARKIEYIQTLNEKEAKLLEEQLIKLFKPKYNVLMTDDKNYPFVSITDETYPRFKIVRGRKDKNCFGPYPDAGALRTALRFVKKLFSLPLCTDAQFARIKKLKNPQSCIYFHIENCSAPCCGKIEPQKYQEKMKMALEFFKGGRFPFEKLKREMEESAKNLNFERAKELRDIVFSLERILEKVSVVPGNKVKYLIEPEKALKELEEITGLEKIPVIDGIDISHLYGDEPSASVVSFVDGLPERKRWRKYSVKFKGIDDYAMIREIIKRRYRHETCDLILIDGGQGQVSSVKKALNEINKKIKVLGLAKREEVIIKEDGKPLKLSQVSSALKLLMYIRDEAHRFAISFHRLKRRKKMVNSEQ